MIVGETEVWAWAGFDTYDARDSVSPITHHGPEAPALDWIGDNSAPLNRIAEFRNDEANYVVAGWS